MIKAKQDWHLKLPAEDSIASNGERYVYKKFVQEAERDNMKSQLRGHRQVVAFNAKISVEASAAIIIILTLNNPTDGLDQKLSRPQL